MRAITVGEWRKLTQAPGFVAQVVDVRSMAEYAAGHLPGAVNIPLNQLEARLADIESGAQVLLVCQGGTRARIAAGWLEQCGRSCLVLEGGTSAWCKAGLRVVQSVATRWSLERQVRLVAGLLILTGVALSLTIHSVWIAISAFVGVGLVFAGLTDICGMGLVLAKMPWNRMKSCPTLQQTNPPAKEDVGYLGGELRRTGQ